MPNPGNVAGCTRDVHPQQTLADRLDAAVQAWAEEQPEQVADYFEDHAGSTTANPFLAEAERAFWRVLG